MHLAASVLVVAAKRRSAYNCPNGYGIAQCHDDSAQALQCDVEMVARGMTACMPCRDVEGRASHDGQGCACCGHSLR